MSILQLEELSAGRIGQVRCRQHANPLKREFAVPASAPDWEAVYTTPTNDLAVDIGSGYGRFNLMMAKLNAAPYNYLGLEIRRPIVQRANLYAQLLGFQGRVHYTVANGTISLPSMLSGYPGKIGLVTVQYPDPHFKKRHQKRRIVQRELVHALAQLLGSGARVLLQSDVQEVSEHMRDEFEAHGAEYFQPSLQHHRPGGVFTCAATPSATATAGEPEAEAGAEAGSAAAGGVELGAAAELEASGSRFRSQWQRHGWLIENPLGVPTERELLSLGQGGNVYRMLLLRTDVPWRKPSV